MKKEQLGEIIIRSEDTMYHIAKTLLYNDADCADAIQEAIVKAFADVHYVMEMYVASDVSKEDDSICSSFRFYVSAMCRFKGNNKSGLDLKNKNLRFTKPDQPFTKQTLETPLIFPII